MSASEFGSSVTVRDVSFNNSTVDSFLHIASVDLGGLSSDSELPKSITAQNIRLQFIEAGGPQSINIATITIDGLPENRDSEFPQHLSLQLEGMEVTLPKKQSLSSTGNGMLDKVLHFIPAEKEKLKIDATVTLNYDSGEKSLTAKTKYGLEKLFVTDMNFELHGFEFRKDLFRIIEQSVGATIEPELEQLLVNSNNVALGKVQIQFHNEGLVDMALQVAAKETGADAMQIKQGILAQLQKAGETFGQDSPAILEVIAELRKFVENPNSLALSASPAEPFKFAEPAAFGDPQALVKNINFKVKAN